MTAHSVNEMTDKLYPLFFNIQGQKVLIVGAGPVAGRKAKVLLDYGAKVSIVAPEAGNRVQELADQGLVKYTPRPFEPGDIDGAKLVFAATGFGQVNDEVASLSRKAGIPINIADGPAESDFHVPSVVDRSPLQIAISTGGAAPALARELRCELERRYPETLSGYVTLLGELRRGVQRSHPALVRDVSEALSVSKARTLWLDGDTDGARQALEEELRTILREGI